MKISFDDCTVLSEDFTKHICVVVLNYYIEHEKRIIEDNKNNAKVVKSSQETLKYLQNSKDYIESYYKRIDNI
ncbi:hypothetical protein EBU91_04715 [bacterium]|nr:hypothetical protein [bacterium]